MPIIDQMDASGFSKLFADECVFKFGNNPASTSPAEIEASVSAFFSSIAGCSHVTLSTDYIEEKKRLYWKGEVTYTRRDEENSKLTIPFINVITLAEDKKCSSYEM